LFVVVKEDTEGWFGHFGGLSRIDSAPIIYPIFFELKFFNVKISEFRRWHDHPSIVWVKAVGRFIGRNGQRIAVTIAGFAVMLAGVALLVLPGPGWLLIFIGLGILSTEYLWARRLLAKAKEKAEQAKNAVVERKNNRAERKARRNGLPTASRDDAV
jgi:hypothetical protein